jgi:ankyrin repeat protein
MSAPELTADEVDFLLEVVDLARTGQTRSLAEAIEAGVPVNLTNAAGDTLLILAAYHCHLDTVEMLLDHGADSARINDRGQTALAAATFRRHGPIVTVLLAAGADPDAGERSARQIATFFSLADMVALLTTSRSILRTGQVSGREADSA